MTRKAIRGLIGAAWVLAIANAIWLYKHMATIPHPQESPTAWLYVTPALIGLLMLIVAEVLLEYKNSGKWGQAVLGALVSLSLVGFTILLRLFRSK